MLNKTKDIINEVGKAVIGKDEVIKKVLTAILAGGHILLEDVPGVGKTTLALSFSKVLGIDYKRVQFTTDTMPSDIVGFSLYNKSENRFVYQQGPVMTNLLLADEINRTSSKTQAPLLEVMEEKRVTVDGETYELPDPFVVIATQNPVGSAGTQLLPSSQLDRFMIRLSMGYPDFKSQVNILKDRHHENPLDNINQIITVDELKEMQKMCENVYVADEIYEYITRLCSGTREHKMVDLGISPRGAIAVCRLAKSTAFIDGRDYVLPQDVSEVFCDVAAHRLVLNRKARINGLSQESIAQDVMSIVEMPKIKVKMGNRL